MQQPSQPAQQSSTWANEVAAGLSNRSRPETVVQNCTQSGRVRGPSPFLHNHGFTQHHRCLHRRHNQ